MNVWYSTADCKLDDFVAELAESAEAAPATNYSSDKMHGIPIYDCANVSGRISDERFRAGLMQEWARVLDFGAGIIVLRRCFADNAPIDAATLVFETIMDEQRRIGMASGDHFARPGANDRIWNALEKLCLISPEVFASYYSNVMIALMCETWLGPNYQMTSQTNLVYPGGEGQTAHRDYHLGFQSVEEASFYPATAHRFSPYLTLQGAVAHCDMPIESGPTKFLPFSQLYEPGYLAYREPEFREYFDANFVQLPLKKGDAVFFNPATFHGAGDNRTSDVKRLANLLQISSAFGRAMESVNRTGMCEKLYPVLLARWQRKEIAEEEIVAAVSSCAEGYPFPTNLDSDPPVDGLAPKSQADIMLGALERGLKQDTFVKELTAHSMRRMS